MTAFVAPTPRVVSGGHVYNRAVLAAWPGPAPELVELDGDWPDGPGTAERLADALTDAGASDVIVDGLVGAAHPRVLAAAEAAGTRLTLLVHLPLADDLTDEVGSTRADVSTTAPEAAEAGGMRNAPLGSHDDVHADHSRARPPTTEANQAVFTHHGVEGERIEAVIARRHDLAERERAAVHACTRVVATSRTAAADLTRRYGRTDIEVAAPGVDPAPLSPGSTPPLILCLASLTPRKNHAALAAALGHLRDRSWTATFAGPADDHATVARVREALTAAGVADRVDLPGAVTGDALQELWSRADVLVLPSLAETYGLVVTEALARGIPVVVNAGTGAVEALRDGPGADPGLVVDANDPRALADALMAVMDDPTWRGRARSRRASLRGWRETAERLRGPAHPTEGQPS